MLVLSWDYRKKLLLNEIKQFNADVSKILIHLLFFKKSGLYSMKNVDINGNKPSH